MIFRYDYALVIDLECSCYEHNAWPDDEKQDIIEIGLCEVDLRGKKILRQESIVVKPLRSKISPYCTQLTGWTQEAVDQGGTLLHASQLLQEKYDSRNRLWVSQGEFDRRIFQENCTALGVPYPFNFRHQNIATMFALLTGNGRQIGMMRELKQLGLPHEGTHHSGVSDAYNTARILLEVLKRGHIDVK